MSRFAVICGALTLLLGRQLPAQAPTPPASEPLHRFDYPAENFSIGVPPTWTEVNPATVARISPLIHGLAPAVPEINVRHWYGPSGAQESGYVWVMVMLMDQHPADSAFEDLESATATANGLYKKWAGSEPGSFFQEAQMENLTYDKSRHVLWGVGRSTVAIFGEIRVLTAAYITRVGTVQAACASRASEYEKHEGTCRQILESVAIDPKVAIKAPVPLSELLAMSPEKADATYRDLVALVKGGDMLIDFRTLRFACVKSNHCDPAGTVEDHLAVNHAATAGQSKRVAELSESLIERGFANLEAHASCAGVYTQLHEMEKAKFHIDVATGLLRSILDAGDGKTEETALEVISRREEYAVMASLGLEYSGPAVVSSAVVAGGPRQYERWEVQDPKAEKGVEKHVVWFNIDAFAGRDSRVGGK